MLTTLEAQQSARPASAPAPTPEATWWTWMASAIPNLIVFVLLGATLYLGHHTDWKLPKLSELTGAAATEDNDWCGEHLVPASRCIECEADLLPKGKPFGFCQEHGVAECVLHHPELAQVNGEVQRPKYDTAKAIALVPRQENNSRNTLHLTRVQFSSKESVDKAGVEVDVVQEGRMTEAVSAPGELVFDPTRVAHLSSRVAGTVVLMRKAIGEPVKTGEVVALVESAQVGQVKAALLQAAVQVQLRKATVGRLSEAAGSGAIPGKTLIEAESALQEAEIALVSANQAIRNLGFELPQIPESAKPTEVAEALRFLSIDAALIDLLPSDARTANLIPVRAPFAGEVVATEAVAGEVIDTSLVLFTIADPTRMWLVLNLRQEDAKYVRLGLPVSFQSDNGDRPVPGTIDWISSGVDEQTRTLRVRVVIDNSDHAFKEKTFGTGRIILREEEHAIVVPSDAVQVASDATFVFVRDKNYFTDGSPKFFHVRQVRIGTRNGNNVELLAGALPGEVVATKGSNVLLAQLLRSSLGAGCGCHPQK